MRGQKVYALIGLITILTVVQLLLTTHPTSAYRHLPPCPPYCYMTYGQVDSVELTSAPIRPSAAALAVSDPGPSKEQGAHKYAYVYADKATKVKVRIGYEVYQIFEGGVKSLVGFSVISNHRHKKKGNTDKETIPELIAFVPGDPNDLTL